MSDDYVSRKRVAAPNSVASASAPTRLEAANVPASVDLSGAARVRFDAKSDAGGVTSVARLLSATASTNATSVKDAAGRIYKIRGYNASTAVVYLKLYDVDAVPDVGTDVPVATIALKPSDVFDISFADLGAYFATGIGFALTGAGADDDTTALTAADVVGMNVWYA